MTRLPSDGEAEAGGLSAGWTGRLLDSGVSLFSSPSPAAPDWAPLSRGWEACEGHRDPQSADAELGMILLVLCSASSYDLDRMLGSIKVLQGRNYRFEARRVPGRRGWRD